MQRGIVICGLFLALSSACGDGAAPGGEQPLRDAAPLSEADIKRVGVAQQAMLAGLPEHVRGALGELLLRDPVSSDVQFVAGSAAYDLQHYGEAVERLTDAVAQNAAFLPNSSALGFAHLKLGQFDAAREAFLRIVTVAPNKHKAHYGLGLVALSLGKLEDARVSLTESLRLSPDYLKAAYAMARLLAAEGRTEEALETVAVVAERWPSHDEALYLMGRLLTTLGRAQQAQVAFDRHEAVYAIKESLGGLGAQLGGPTDSPALRLKMAELHLGIGDTGEARRTLSAALRLYPDDPSLEEARNRLLRDR